MRISSNLCFATWPQASRSFLFVYSIFLRWNSDKLSITMSWGPDWVLMFVVCALAHWITLYPWLCCKYSEEIKAILKLGIVRDGPDKWGSFLVMKKHVMKKSIIIESSQPQCYLCSISLSLQCLAFIVGSNLTFVCVTLGYLLHCCVIKGKSLSGFSWLNCVSVEHQELCADHWGPQVFISFLSLWL